MNIHKKHACMPKKSFFTDSGANNITLYTYVQRLKQKIKQDLDNLTCSGHDKTGGNR